MGWDEDIAIEKGMEVDNHNAMIAERDAEIARLKGEIAWHGRIVEADSEDASILLAIAQYFYTDGVDRGDRQPFVDAVKFAIDDTGIHVNDMLDHITRLGFTVDEDDFVRDWIVTVTVPVTVNLRVQAASETDAADLALEEVDANGVDGYSMEYNIRYDGEVTEIEEMY